MRDTTSRRDLYQRIEQLVRQHIAAIHRSAREVLERAFVGATSPRPASGFEVSENRNVQPFREIAAYRLVVSTNCPAASVIAAP